MVDDFLFSSVNFKEILDNVATGVYVITKDRKIIYWNVTAEKITGFSKSEIINRKCPETPLKHIDDAGINLCENACPLVESIETGKKVEKRVWVHTKKGPVKHILVKTIPFYRNGRIIGVVETFDDISYIDELKKLNKKLKEISIRDELTSLYNRRELYRHLNIIISKVGRGLKFAILMIDIDKFKRINDCCGHLEGDRILVEVSKELKKNLRVEDTTFRPISVRFGGDEFVVIIEMGEKAPKESILTVAKRISESFSKIESCNGPLKASMGITLVFKSDTANDILKRADEALYSSKSSGKPVFLMPNE